jgi:hypothetical protein
VIQMTLFFSSLILFFSHWSIVTGQWKWECKMQTERLYFPMAIDH